jgi:hypothetical protein
LEKLLANAKHMSQADLEEFKDHSATRNQISINLGNFQCFGNFENRYKPEKILSVTFGSIRHSVTHCHHCLSPPENIFLSCKVEILSENVF